MPGRSAPRDQVPPAVIPDGSAPLEIQLAGLLRACGAQVARAVDGRRGVVLAEVGLPHGDDVAALVRLARSAAPVAAAHGELVGDLVVTAGRAVHVLRECGSEASPAVLHVRLDPAIGDVATARRGLAAPALDGAVRAAAGRYGSFPVAPVPLPRLPADPAARAQEPALAALDATLAWQRTGRLAADALPPVVPLPRRASGGGARRETSGQKWACDVDTMGRVLAALCRLP
jgi:hypothetical protein